MHKKSSESSFNSLVISSIDDFNNASLPLIICNKDFLINRVNKSFENEYPSKFTQGSHLDTIFPLLNREDPVSSVIQNKGITVKEIQKNDKETVYYKFERIVHYLNDPDIAVISIDDVTSEVKRNKGIYQKFFGICNLLPIPVIVSDFEKKLFINDEGIELIKKIFGSVATFKSELENFNGLYKTLMEQNDVVEKYKIVRETGQVIRNIFISIIPSDYDEKCNNTEIILLMNISRINDLLTDEPIAFLTTFENITEVFNFNKELHYSLLNLKGVIEAFAKDRIAYLLAYGEEETAMHMIEVRTFSEMIADAIMKDNTIPNKAILEYSKVTPLYIKMLGLSAILHDFGKVDSKIRNIIKEPRKLTPEEYELVKTHTRLGANLIGYENEILKMCWLVALYHHERWDGSGYPEGLKERDIPLSARIVAFADMYSALRSRRAYKDPIHSYEYMIQIMKENESIFDPVVFRIGTNLIPEMEKRSKTIEDEYKGFEMTSEDVVKLITDVFNAITNRDLKREF